MPTPQQVYIRYTVQNPNIYIYQVYQQGASGWTPVGGPSQTVPAGIAQATSELALSITTITPQQAQPYAQQLTTATNECTALSDRLRAGGWTEEGGIANPRQGVGQTMSQAEATALVARRAQLRGFCSVLSDFLTDHGWRYRGTVNGQVNFDTPGGMGGQPLSNRSQPVTPPGLPGGGRLDGRATGNAPGQYSPRTELPPPYPPPPANNNPPPGGRPPVSPPPENPPGGRPPVSPPPENPPGGRPPGGTPPENPPGGRPGGTPAPDPNCPRPTTPTEPQGGGGRPGGPGPVVEPQPQGGGGRPGGPGPVVEPQPQGGGGGGVVPEIPYRMPVWLRGLGWIGIAFTIRHVGDLAVNAMDLEAVNERRNSIVNANNQIRQRQAGDMSAADCAAVSALLLGLQQQLRRIEQRECDIRYGPLTGGFRPRQTRWPEGIPPVVRRIYDPIFDDLTTSWNRNQQMCGPIQQAATRAAADPCARRMVDITNSLKNYIVNGQPYPTQVISVASDTANEQLTSIADRIADGRITPGDGLSQIAPIVNTYLTAVSNQQNIQTGNTPAETAAIQTAWGIHISMIMAMVRSMADALLACQQPPVQPVPNCQNCNNPPLPPPPIVVPPPPGGWPLPPQTPEPPIGQPGPPDPPDNCDCGGNPPPQTSPQLQQR